MDLTQVDAHFEFGENWADFANSIDEGRIEAAQRTLWRLVPQQALAGRSMIDIGSGSGLSALAALRSGCARLLAVDLDPDSVATTRAVLTRFAEGGPWEARQVSVFDLSPERDGRFDVVHSWGVLHHTGRMWDAIGRAADLVADGGLFALAIYAKTPVCGFWRWEKRFYTAAPEPVRKLVRGIFKVVYLAGVVASGRNPASYVRAYGAERGMSWSHDIHDWLGGFPYESASPEEIAAFLGARGFALESQTVRPVPVAGLLGSPCHEYLFRKRAD